MMPVQTSRMIDHRLQLYGLLGDAGVPEAVLLDLVVDLGEKLVLSVTSLRTHWEAVKTMIPCARSITSGWRGVCRASTGCASEAVNRMAPCSAPRPAHEMGLAGYV